MTDKLSKATIRCTFSFTEPQEEEFFDAREIIETWARQEIMHPRNQTIFMEEYDVVSTEPWVELKPVALNLPGRDEKFISTDELEEQYRLSNPKKVSQAGFIRYVLKEFDITYEVIRN